MNLFMIIITRPDEEPSHVADTVINSLKAAKLVAQGELVRYHVLFNVVVIFRSNLQLVPVKPKLRGVKREPLHSSR